MKWFVLLTGVLIAVLVAAGCSSGDGSSGFDRISAPINPVPGLVSGPEGDGSSPPPEIMTIYASSTSTSKGGIINFSLALPLELEGAAIAWTVKATRPGHFGGIGTLSTPNDYSTSWTAPDRYGLFTLTATADDVGETSASITVAVTKGTILQGPSHVGFYNPPTFSVHNAPAGSSIAWSIDPAGGVLTPGHGGQSVTWKPDTWRSSFYTVTATITDGDVDFDDGEPVILTHQFSTSFCSQGRTNTPANPCGIENIHQLAAIHYFLDGHFVLLNDIDASETRDWNTQPGTGRYGFWPLGADATQDPLPLGSLRRIETTNFSGSFDGGKHTISNLHIVWPGSIGVGLFGFVHNDAVIKDVYLSKATVVGYEFVGGIAGRLEGTITGSSVTDSTISFAGHGRTCSSQPNFHQGDRVGGLVGLVSSGGGAVGDSYALRTDVSGCAWVGGLAGIVGGVVTDSYSMGGIVNSPIATWRGGFTGQVSSNGKVSRTFALMGDSVAYTGLASNGAVIEHSYWSSDYPEAANQSLYAEDIPVAQFSQIIDNLGAAWELKNDGPGAFIDAPNLIGNSR